MKFSEVAPAVRRLVRDFGLDPESSPYGNGRLGSAKARSEASLHEMAHGITLRLRPPITGPKIAAMVGVMSDRDSDWDELKALAIEFRTLQRLGLPFKRTDIASFAAGNMRAIKDAVRVERIAMRLERRRSTRRAANRIVSLLRERGLRA